MFQIEFNFKQKTYNLFEEKLKKINFLDFFCQNQKVLKLKVTKGELIISIHLEIWED